MKLYILFRNIVLLLGSLPGFLILWPLTLYLISLVPDVIAGPVFDGVLWFVREAMFLGYADDFPLLHLFVLLFFPPIFGYLMLLVENLSGLFVAVEKAEAKFFNVGCALGDQNPRSIRQRLFGIWYLITQPFRRT